MFHSNLSFARRMAACTYLSNRSPKIDSGVGLTQLSNTWRTSRSSSNIRIVPIRFHRISLTRSMTSTAGILASSAISLPVLFASILEPAEFIFLRTFSVNVHDSQPYRRFGTTDEPKRWSRRLVGSFVSVVVVVVFCFIP